MFQIIRRRTITSLLFRQEADFALTLSAEQTFARPEVSAGLVLFFRAIACGMVSALFALTTDPGQLVRALMIHARLPATVGFALLQALNLVPDLAREAQQIRLALEAAGYRLQPLTAMA